MKRVKSGLEILKKENEILKAQVDLLKTHIAAQPDGALFLEAQRDFESRQNSKRENKDV